VVFALLKLTLGSGTDHFVADDHIPALPPASARWRCTRSNAINHYAASAQEFIVFPWMFINNMEGSWITIIRFNYS